MLILFVFSILNHSDKIILKEATVSQQFDSFFLYFSHPYVVVRGLNCDDDLFGIVTEAPLPYSSMSPDCYDLLILLKAINKINLNLFINLNYLWNRIIQFVDVCIG